MFGLESDFLPTSSSKVEFLSGWVYCRKGAEVIITIPPCSSLCHLPSSIGFSTNPEQIFGRHRSRTGARLCCALSKANYLCVCVHTHKNCSLQFLKTNFFFSRMVFPLQCLILVCFPFRHAPSLCFVALAAIMLSCLTSGGHRAPLVTKGGGKMLEQCD